MSNKAYHVWDRLRRQFALAIEFGDDDHAEWIRKRMARIQRHPSLRRNALEHFHKIGNYYGRRY